MAMHHMLIILTLTFIQGRTDLNHQNNKCLIISETVQAIPIKKLKTEMTASVQENKSKHTRLKINAFQYRQEKTMYTFSAYVAFNKVTNGQTDII